MMQRILAAGVALAAAALAAPAPASAATLRIAGGTVAVSPGGRVAIALTNPTGRAAAGSLRLTAGRMVVAQGRFRVSPRRTRRVVVDLTAGGAARLLRRRALPVRAVARARGLRPARRTVTLRAPARRAVEPPAPRAVEPPAPRAVEPPATRAAEPAARWRDGRYRGRFADNNVDLAFNVVGARLFTGPFDGVYLSATCRNVDPAYAGPDQVYPDATSFGWVEAAIAADGAFAGEGIHHTGSTPPIPWRIVGEAAGDTLQGEFSASYTDAWGNPCSGTTRFEARWYGDYTL